MYNVVGEKKSNEREKTAQKKKTILIIQFVLILINFVYMSFKQNMSWSGHTNGLTSNIIGFDSISHTIICGYEQKGKKVRPTKNHLRI